MIVPAVVTVPVDIVVLPLVGVFGGWSVLWRVSWIFLSLLFAAGVILAVVFLAMERDVCRVELRPGDPPRLLVVKRARGSAAIPIGDLQRIAVLECVCLGRRKALHVILHTAGGPVTCRAAASSPMAKVRLTDLAGWLTQVLGQAGVPVECETLVEKAGVPFDRWWQAPRVAAVWQVPVERVPEIAERLEVKGRSWEPRAGAMYQPGRLTPVHYNPDDVFEVLERVRAENPAPS